MKSKRPLVVFSDLDGTLIDHETYSFAPARPALDALDALSVPLILASSKTAPEIAEIRDRIGINHWPAIIENGAGLLPPRITTVSDQSDYVFVRAALDQIDPTLRQLFQGFGDASVDEVVAMTGLDRPDAERARMRSFSEPGRWSGSDDQKIEFLAALSALKVKAQQGGRFLTLSRGLNKVDQMGVLIDQFKPRQTVALGDAPNDIAMLEAADFAVVIANAHSAALPALKDEGRGAVLRSKLPGPEGWNAAILQLLSELKLR